MIRPKEKNSITWLLIASMLHLMLIAASSSMVMADPSETMEAAGFQSVGEELPPCHNSISPVADESISQTDCDNCANNTCTDNCSYCTQINISLNGYNVELPAKPEKPVNSSTSAQPFDPGYTPLPYPPKQSHS